MDLRKGSPEFKGSAGRTIAAVWLPSWLAEDTAAPTACTSYTTTSETPP